MYDRGWRSRQAVDKTYGECGEYGRDGRFADKSGQQVGAALLWSADNEKIKAAYGNYGLWSWLRYWHLDSTDEVAVVLMDKGYYDYDYKKPDDDWKAVKSSAKSDEELAAKLASFGFSVKPKADKPTTAEDIQREIMEDSE